MTDAEYQYDELCVFDPAYDPVVADSVAPQSAERVAQRPSEAAGILGRPDAVGNITEDCTLHGMIEPP